MTSSWGIHAHSPRPSLRPSGPHLLAASPGVVLDARLDAEAFVGVLEARVHAHVGTDVSKLGVRKETVRDVVNWGLGKLESSDINERL